MQVDAMYDVVVVGGGAAGLSGAVALSRARRSVLVVDDGTPRNAGAEHVHNYLGREGTPPGELLAAGRAEAAGYGAALTHDTVTTAAAAAEGGFEVGLGSGTEVRARRLLVSTGLTDELPGVPGLRERWGRDVLHCPYCHGYEVRDQAIGVLSTGPFAVHQAHLFRQLSPSVALLRHTGPELSDGQREELGARGIQMVDGEVTGLEITEDRLTGVRLVDGGVLALDALVVSPRFQARSGLLSALGLTAAAVEMAGYAIGSSIAAEPTGATTVPGVYVAGNVSDLRAQVIGAAAAGLNAAAAINADLVAGDVAAAVARHRAWRTADHARVFDEDFWEDRYRGRTAVWSGRPNAVLVEETTGAPPGSALDVGCGEGGDALWLAERGWQVTGVDFAAGALQRAAGRAERMGLSARTEWMQADVTAWAPPGAAFDLVTAHFLHLPADRLRPLFARLAAAVAPDGTLLLVGHHPDDVHTTMRRPDLDAFFTAQDVAAALNPAIWTVEISEARPRSAVDPEGRSVTIQDAVLRARRHVLTGPARLSSR